MAELTEEWKQNPEKEREVIKQLFNKADLN